MANLDRTAVETRLANISALDGDQHVVVEGRRGTESFTTTGVLRWSSDTAEWALDVPGGRIEPFFSPGVFYSAVNLAPLQLQSTPRRTRTRSGSRRDDPPPGAAATPAPISVAGSHKQSRAEFTGEERLHVPPPDTMSLMDQLARMMDVALAKHSATTEAQVRRIVRDSAAQSTVAPQAPAPCPLPPSSFPPHCQSQASAMSQHSAHDDDVVRKALGITADSLKLLTAVIDSRRDEVTTSITSSLAARGRDVVLWRVAEGLIFNKFVEDRFKIFSIPHLVAADGGHNRNRARFLFLRFHRPPVKAPPSIATYRR